MQTKSSWSTPTFKCGDSTSTTDGCWQWTAENGLASKYTFDADSDRETISAPGDGADPRLVAQAGGNGVPQQTGAEARLTLAHFGFGNDSETPFSEAPFDTISSVYITSVESFLENCSVPSAGTQQCLDSELDKQTLLSARITSLSQFLDSLVSSSSLPNSETSRSLLVVNRSQQVISGNAIDGAGYSAKELRKHTLRQEM